MKDKKMILLEGNIGAGKSTVGQALKTSGLFDFIEEPVETWQTGFASNLLEAFYRDMNRWAFTFQILAFTTRAKTWEDILSNTNHNRVVLERSIFTDRYVFATSMHQIGAMSDAEWHVYCHMWDFLVSRHCAQPDCILYLRTPAEICLERIKIRDRTEESSITLDYLQQLEMLHDQWLLEHPCSIVLDGIKVWTADKVSAITEPLWKAIAK